MRSMTQIVLFALMMAASASATARAAETRAPYPTPASFSAFLYASPAEEIAQARTAAPPSISNDAEIMTLGPRGYEVSVKGKNGFVCLVDRAWSKPFDDREFWNPKMRAPECWNTVATRSVLPIFLERTRWVLAGVPKAEIEARTRAALASKRLPRPEAGNMVYMMAKQGYMSDDGPPHWHPHVMFYLPVKSTDWGANTPGAPVYQGDDGAIALTTFFVLAEVVGRKLCADGDEVICGSGGLLDVPRELLGRNRSHSLATPSDGRRSPSGAAPIKVQSTASITAGLPHGRG